MTKVAGAPATSFTCPAARDDPKPQARTMGRPVLMHHRACRSERCITASGGTCGFRRTPQPRPLSRIIAATSSGSRIAPPRMPILWAPGVASSPIHPNLLSLSRGPVPHVVTGPVPWLWRLNQPPDHLKQVIERQLPRGCDLSPSRRYRGGQRPHLVSKPRQGSIDAGKRWDRSAPASHAATGVSQWLGAQSPGDPMLALSTRMN